ncbi:MAG: hypothetical protein QHJ73_10940, partial [Armatimonadota bacterium]|nr:hypothetical protein [Armatimonadota bacterium]
RVEFLEGPALEFQPSPAWYHAVLCIGASFALGDFDSAVAWMRRAMKPEGVLAIGEPFLHEWPLPNAARSTAPPWASSLRDLPGTVEALEAHGLELTGFIAASLDDWDAYYSAQWSAAYAWARENPSHSGRGEVLAQTRQARESYLRWDRRYTGWGIFIARAA